MVLDQEMLNVKTFFESRDIPLSDFWLESCIKWYREQTAPETYTETQLRNTVYEQWLLLDLREVELPSLPPCLKDHKKFVFNGNYCLQVMCVVDIAKPKHWQLSKIRNANVLTNAIENDKDISDSKRMLQLTLTDGIQEVDAVEYQLVPSLNLNLTPGIKIRLLGPITVRRGKIMLEARNVKVLGGEVEEIVVSNATENVLARELGLPENPNPGCVNVEAVNPPTENSFSNNRNVCEAPMVTIRSNAATSVNHVNGSTRALPSNRCDESLDDIDEDEEMRIAEEVEMLMNAENAARPGPSEPPEKRITPDMFDDDFPNDFESFDTFEKVAALQKTCKAGKIATSTQKTTETINLLDSTAESEDDLFRDINIDSHLDKIDNECREKQPVNIKVLHENIRTLAEGVFRIKAKFKAVVEKLTVTNQAWSFKIEVEDSTGTLVVNVHNDVITKLAECGPSVIMDLKNKVGDADNSAELAIRNVILNFKKKLLVLDCPMDVQIKVGEAPVITAVYQ